MRGSKGILRSHWQQSGCHCSIKVSHNISQYEDDSEEDINGRNVVFVNLTLFVCCLIIHLLYFLLILIMPHETNISFLKYVGRQKSVTPLVYDLEIL